MISQNEVSSIVAVAIPDLKDRCDQAHANSPYKMARELVVYLRRQLIANNKKGVQLCLQVADNLYRQGNFVVKNAIETVFVFSLSHCFLQGRAGNELKQMLPAQLGH
ncbi:MAG: hypothetical protein EBZ77_03165, partial [Chitinophagia bacterium]|nr:hypothetical protein [Chitinophagia bacterium]